MTQSSANSTQSTVTIVGAGLAGLAAGCALANAGYRVQLLERRPYVGGRASSYEHPGTGEVIDNCQHILLGCCTNLIDLYARLGAEESISWFKRITYLEPGGRRSVLEPSILPAPMHTALAFVRTAAFTLADKFAIAYGLSQFIRGIPQDSGETFSQWCVRHRQTSGAVKRFWEPILVSALNEDLDRISVHYAGQVFRESFLRSPQAGRMGIPRVPLSELYGRAVDYIRERGGEVHLRASVDAISRSSAGDAGWRVCAGGREFASEAVVLALSFEGMQKLLPLLPQTSAATALAKQLSTFEHSPITGIHLWFDREITDLEHAVLLDATIQWMFHKSKLQPELRGGQGSYIELVVSASRSMVPMQRQEIIDLAVRELALFFPKVKEAVLLKAAIVKEVRATYSVRPGIDRVRPHAGGIWPGIYLAGDWTATGWPATMEGAVRSGYLAAEALTQHNGSPERFLVNDLGSTGFMRLLP